MIERDMEPEDFPLSIYVHWHPRSVGASWLWAVTVLPPAPGTRTPLCVPGFGGKPPVWVTTVTASDGVPRTSGPYQENADAQR